MAAKRLNGCMSWEGMHHAWSWISYYIEFPAGKLNTVTLDWNCFEVRVAISWSWEKTWFLKIAHLCILGGPSFFGQMIVDGSVHQPTIIWTKMMSPPPKCTGANFSRNKFWTLGVCIHWDRNNRNLWTTWLPPVFSPEAKERNERNTSRFVNQCSWNENHGHRRQPLEQYKPIYLATQ